MHDSLTDDARNFLLFRSELFIHRQEDFQIGHWFVGGDCAGWLYARLLALPNIEQGTDPLMEDWGWYASVQTKDTATSIALLIYAWDFLDHCWLIGLEPKRRLLRRKTDKIIRAATDCIADAIDEIIVEDDRFESFGWQEKNPFKLDVTDPRKW